MKSVNNLLWCVFLFVFIYFPYFLVWSVCLFLFLLLFSLFGLSYFCFFAKLYVHILEVLSRDDIFKAVGKFKPTFFLSELRTISKILLIEFWKKQHGLSGNGRYHMSESQKSKRLTDFSQAMPLVSFMNSLVLIEISLSQCC